MPICDEVKFFNIINPDNENLFQHIIYCANYITQIYIVESSIGF